MKPEDGCNPRTDHEGLYGGNFGRPRHIDGKRLEVESCNGQKRIRSLDAISQVIRSGEQVK